MSKMYGRPCWFELATSDTAGATRFYEPLLRWRVGESESPDIEYRLAKAGDEVVAGLMPLDFAPEGTPPNWLTYICVESADQTTKLAAEKGATVVKPPADVPGTGRFAVLQDPQGAHFGILQPDMSQMPQDMQEKARAGEIGAWNQRKAGHGNWLELMSTDPEAGFDFYAALFGWTKGAAIDMSEGCENGEGPGGTYQLFQHDGTDIGGMMGLGKAPVPVWLPYFGVDDPVTQVIDAIKSSGGHVEAGPVEVPGPAYIAVGSDPQGAWFAVVGATR